MVNYCCVYGCGRNNKVHKHLTYYSVPKTRDRQEQWLRAAGREDLLGKPSFRSVRLCSRHFEPSQIKKRHLAPDAIPTLCLPGSLIFDTQDNEPEKHNGLVCNSCSDTIVGFRYKCIICHDYDLCQKCEMLEVHPDHLMIRINRPMKFTTTNNLIKKWRDLIKNERDNYCDNTISDDDNGYLSSDDEPITKYTRENDDGVDVPDDIKAKIRKEIARVLKSRNDESKTDKVKSTKKRPAEGVKPSKRMRKDVPSGNEKETDESDGDHEVEELAFADVDDIKIIKCETIVNSSTEQECVAVLSDEFI